MRTILFIAVAAIIAANLPVGATSPTGQGIMKSFFVQVSEASSVNMSLRVTCEHTTNMSCGAAYIIFDSQVDFEMLRGAYPNLSVDVATPGGEGVHQVVYQQDGSVSLELTLRHSFDGGGSRRVLILVALSESGVMDVDFEKATEIFQDASAAEWLSPESFGGLQVRAGIPSTTLLSHAAWSASKGGVGLLVPPDHGLSDTGFIVGESRTGPAGDFSCFVNCIDIFRGGPGTYSVTMTATETTANLGPDFFGIFADIRTDV